MGTLEIRMALKLDMYRHNKVDPELVVKVEFDGGLGKDCVPKFHYKLRVSIS
jgi:hypothetical protein